MACGFDFRGTNEIEGSDDGLLRGRKLLTVSYIFCLDLIHCDEFGGRNLTKFGLLPLEVQDGFAPPIPHRYLIISLISVVNSLIPTSVVTSLIPTLELPLIRDN